MSLVCIHFSSLASISLFATPATPEARPLQSSHMYEPFDREHTPPHSRLRSPDRTGSFSLRSRSWSPGNVAIPVIATPSVANDQIHRDFSLGMKTKDQAALHWVLMDMLLRRDFFLCSIKGVFPEADHADADLHSVVGILRDSVENQGGALLRVTLRLVWKGDKNMSPTTLPDHLGDSLLQRLPHYAPSVDYTFSIVDVQCLDGTAVLPALPDGTPRMNFVGLDKFLGNHFFSPEPDTEEVIPKIVPTSSGGDIVVQTWTVAVSLDRRVTDPNAPDDHC